MKDPGSHTASDDHPRLFMSPADLPRLRADRLEPARGPIWQNLRASAEVAAARALRSEWIAPLPDDPLYANLYDRFYGAMSDMAVVEHLAFVALIGEEPAMIEAARRRLVATAGAWASEIQVSPDYGTAYAITRLMKGLAVGYDLLYGWLDDRDRKEVETLVERLADRYVAAWFSQPAQLDTTAHTHHAHLEWASFGLTALALLGRVPAAAGWLRIAVAKFERDLLPRGLAADGAQIEGPSFWASTMQYRLMFMDALQRVTGHDLFVRHERSMSADVSFAAVAATRRSPADEPSSSVLLEPAYAQLGYHAPVYEGLARFYRRPHLRYLAQWDELVGAIIDADHETPGGERLLFALGPYAYLWRDETVSAVPEDHPLIARFDSVGEAYLRGSWLPGDAIAGVRQGGLVVSLGGRVALADLEPKNLLAREASVAAGTAVWRWEPHELVQALDEIGTSGVASAATWTNRVSATRMTVDVRPGEIRVARVGPQRRIWWCARGARRVGETTIAIPGEPEVVVGVVRGVLESFDPVGHRPSREVGYNSLKRVSRDLEAWPLVTVRPDGDDRLEVEVRRS